MTKTKDCELHMWEYWRDKYGHEMAASDYYPAIFAGDSVLADALKDLEWAKQLIDMRMEHLLEQSPTES